MNLTKNKLNKQGIKLKGKKFVESGGAPGHRVQETCNVSLTDR